jgi:hypothetical protein
VKRSPSGTRQPADGLRAQTIILLLALAVVLAFAASAIFGLRRSSSDSQLQPAAVDSVSTAVVPDARGRVEVLNGAGVPGLAKLATETLRDAGFDVVQFGNARRSADSSSVMDRIGSIEVATEVGRTLGITNVKTVIDTTRFVDATVVLGKDWAAKGKQVPQ